MDRRYWLMLLIALVTGSSMAVIYVKHESRLLFSEIRFNQKYQDELRIQWSRLQIQKSTLITQANVEAIARKKLDMVSPEKIQIVTLVEYD